MSLQDYSSAFFIFFMEGCVSAFLALFFCMVMPRGESPRDGYERDKDKCPELAHNVSRLSLMFQVIGHAGHDDAFTEKQRAL